MKLMNDNNDNESNDSNNINEKNKWKVINNEIIMK